MKISIIVAKSSNNGIGIDNKLPWKNLSADMKRFKNITMGHHMIMGRKTFESIGKPLPGRVSIIVTRNTQYKAEGCLIANSIEDAINIAKESNETEVFIIGGADIIIQSENIADTIYLTQIHEEFPADVFLNLNDKWQEIIVSDHLADEKNPYNYSFINLEK